MSRFYPHRYKVLSGQHEGLVSDGQQIGCQDYPEQFIKERMDSETINSKVRNMHFKGLHEGVWLDEVQQPLYRPIPQPGHPPKMEITDEGMNYSDVYMDLCVPFDRYGNEIKVGDTLMIASKNEVRRAEVIAIAKKPYIASYGIANRKLTVRDEEEKQTLTINDPRATVKV